MLGPPPGDSNVSEGMPGMAFLWPEPIEACSIRENVESGKWNRLLFHNQGGHRTGKEPFQQ